MNENSVPRLATLDDDGWALSNAESRFEQAIDVFWLPDRWVRDHLEEHVPDGGFVKLMFRILDPSEPAEPAIERMWVTLDSREGAFYHGHLANDPHTQGTAHDDMPVWFGAEHVVDYAGTNGDEKASEVAKVVRCSQHGINVECFVCEHLTLDSEGRGFHVGSPDELRPDAWCDQCHREFMRSESWEAPGTSEPRVKLICGGCYDAVRAKHVRK